MAKPIVLNDPSLYKVRSRTNQKGVTRSRISIEVQSEPILLDYDDRNFGKATSEAFKSFLQQKGNLANGPVAPATVEYRQKVLRNQGSAWAKRRYAGGRTGATPGESGNLTRGLRFSGRLLDGLAVRQNPKDKSFTVNVPANRLVLPGMPNSSSRNMTEFQRILDYVDQHLPWLRDPGRAVRESREIRAAVREDVKWLISVASKRNKDLLRERRKQLANLFGFRGLSQLL